MLLFYSRKSISLLNGIVNISFPIRFNDVLGAKKNRLKTKDFEYQHYMLWLRNKKINFLLCTLNLNTFSGQEILQSNWHGLMIA